MHTHNVKPMANIGNEAERFKRIRTVTRILKEAKEKKNGEINVEEFIRQIMNTWCVTRRTAQSYVKQAQSTLDDNVKIIELVDES